VASSLFTAVGVERIAPGSSPGYDVVVINISAWEDYLNQKWSLFSWYANFYIRGARAKNLQIEPGSRFNTLNFLGQVDTGLLSIAPLGSTANTFFASQNPDDFLIAIVTVEISQEISLDDPLIIQITSLSLEQLITTPTIETITAGKGANVYPSPEGNRSNEIGEINLEIGYALDKAIRLEQQGSNETPTDLSLSASSFYENISAGSVVATLNSSDPDAGETFSYTLVPGSGDTDNAAFSLTGNQLQINAYPDFETKSSYSIRLRTTDAGGLFTEKTFSLSVLNVNETPTDLSLSASSFYENISAGSVVATLNSSDPDAGETFSYTLVPGSGDTDNNAFSISGNKLSINTSPDFESKSSYSIRVRSTDQGGLSTERALTLSVTNVVELSIVGVEPLRAEQPSLDFTALAGQSLSGQVVLKRMPSSGIEASVGFYKTIDSSGTVLDDLGKPLAPGDDGYTKAALSVRNIVSSMSGLKATLRDGDLITGSRSFSLSDDAYLAPYAKLSNTVFDPVITPTPPAVSAGSATVLQSPSPGYPITPTPLATVFGGRQLQATVFAFAAANADSVSYFRSLDSKRFSMATRLDGLRAMDQDELLVRIDI